MSPSRLLTLLLLLLLVFTLLADDVEAARRRRRRRRKHRPAGGEGAAGAVGAKSIRRIRHASGRRAEFVRRRLRKAKMQQDVEGNIRLVDGRADYEGEWDACVLGGVGGGGWGR